MASSVDGVDCRDCGTEAVYMDVKEEPRSYKVGASCHTCGYDYGVLTRISRSEVDHVDEVYELGERSITDILSDP